MSALETMMKNWSTDRRFFGSDEMDLYRSCEAELSALRAKLERAEKIENDADKLRRNFAKYLAAVCLENRAETAAFCDEQLDRSGALLGYVREEAALLEQSKGE